MNYNYNNSTMNNNINDNDNDYTMHDSKKYSSKDGSQHGSSSSSSTTSSILMAEAVLSPPAQQHQPGPSSALYKLAARNLRKHHGVPSMTALKLEKTMALLCLRPRRMVVQGLAPRRLLKGGEGESSPLVLPGDSLDETGELADENLINDSSSSSSSTGDEEDGEDGLNDTYDDKTHNSTGDLSGGDDTDGDAEGFEADGNGNGQKRRPLHAAMVAGGVNLRPDETRPLLCALGVSSHRLVKLGLVEREAIRTMARWRRGGRDQHLRAGGPGKRGLGRPRGPSRGPPHTLGGPSPECGPPRRMHGPPGCRHLHGAGRHTKRVRGEGREKDGMSAPMGPHGGPEHRGPHFHVGCLRGPPHGPGHHGMPTARHGHGPPGGGGNHGHGHGHGHVGFHGEKGGEGGGNRLHAGARGPGHRGPRHPGKGGMGRSRGRPQGPPHGPPFGPFHRLFREEGASGAPPGMRSNPRHGLSPRAGGDLKQRGGRHGGGTGFCGGGRGGGGGGGGGAMRLRRVAHLAHCEHCDGRHQPRLEAEAY